MSQKTKIVIIGGVAGGATAAARARRVNENATITLIERGGYVSFANCGLPYHISGEIKNRDQLFLQNPEGFKNRYNVDVMISTSVTEIDSQAKVIVAQNPALGKINIPYDTLILSQGGAPLSPQIEGLNPHHAFTMKNIEDMDKLMQFLNGPKKPKRAIVIGAGFIGLEMAESLHHLGLEVSIVEKSPQIMAPFDSDFAKMAEKIFKTKGIDFFLNTEVLKAQEESDGRVLLLKNDKKISYDLIIFSAGVFPELELAKKAGLAVGNSGGLLVDSKMQTSNSSIYAVGDMVEIAHSVSGQKVRLPLAGPANRQARIAASNCAGKDIQHYMGAMGTSVIRIFDHSLGCTGLTEKYAKQLGLEYDSILVQGKNHAGYFPNSSRLWLKVVFRKSDGLIWGAQAFGKDGVDKRIDVIASAILGKLKIADLEHLDLAYAPPFSSANDPVNIAGFMGQNKQTGFCESINPSEYFEKDTKQAHQLIDVRTPAEFSKGSLEQARNIPLDELRTRYKEIDIKANTVVFCQIGKRGYLAARILQELGYKVKNISGGYEAMSEMV